MKPRGRHVRARKRHPLLIGVGVAIVVAVGIAANIPAGTARPSRPGITLDGVPPPMPDPAPPTPQLDASSPQLRPGAQPQPQPQPQPTGAPTAPGIAIASAAIDLPDPFLLETGGNYYLYVSSAFGDTRMENVPVLEGSPGNWRRLADALPVLPPWAVPTAQGGTTWAPEVHRFGNHYVLYFASTLRGSSSVKPLHCIGIAASFSGSPTGPFVPARAPFICDPSQGGDIDAQVFVDPRGPSGPSQPNYLVWKSDNNSTPGDGDPHVWVQPLSNDGLSLLGHPTEIFEAHLTWQNSVVEAPQLVQSPDLSVWLIYSAGSFAGTSYVIGVARCAGPLGPCTAESAPFIASNAQGAGPGEQTVFTADDGSTWLLYNPWSADIPDEWTRPVEAVRVGWAPSGPYVAQAGTFPSPS